MSFERLMLVEHAGAEEEIDLLKLLNSGGWIGLSWAVDWIAFRGKTIEEFDNDEAIARHDDAANQLVKCLQRLQSNLRSGEQLMMVVGEWLDVDDAGNPEWWKVLVDPNDFGTNRYFLDLTGGEDIVGGGTADLIGMTRSWTNVRISADFILENWPPTEGTSVLAKKMPAPMPLRTRPPQDRVKAKTVEIIAAFPAELVRPTFEEVTVLLRDCFPSITNDQCTETYRDLRTDDIRPGARRGTRLPDRKARFENFRQKMRPADSRN